MSSPGKRRFLSRRFLFVVAAPLLIVFFAPLSARAVLEVTEVMYNPLDEEIWEWIEVRNTGLNPIDLNGAYGDSLGDPRILPTDPPSISSLNTNTVIPAGGIAVLYDANYSGSMGADPNSQVFRDAWGLSGSVPVIGVDFFPTLANGGSSIGFWEDYSSYALDLVNPGGGFVVDSFDNALFGIDFRNTFPVAPNGTSMRWNGHGDYRDSVYWTLSESGVNYAVTSGPASVYTPINDTADIGSPGVKAAGFWPGLLVTELMVSPASDIPEWQWIEVFNGTGSMIDFDATPYVLDDDDGDDLLSANIASGSIPNGEVAVLFNGDALTLENMQDAWDPNGTIGTNFISVSNFSTLETSTERVALWGSFADYQSEDVTGPGRSTVNAAAVLVYDDDGSDWPSFNGISSNFLKNLGADPNGDFYGDFWAQSSLSDPNLPAFHAAEALGGVEVYTGGDVGSPGDFVMTSLNDADFDDDNDVDGVDFTIWQRGYQVGSTHADGDANGDGIVDGADLAIWESQYGQLPIIVPDADFDDDNDVDGVDFAIWQRGYQLGSTHAKGDANGDGFVDGADLQIWESQYGNVPPIGGFSNSPSTVPEPTSLCLFAMALFSLAQFPSRWCRR